MFETMHYTGHARPEVARPQFQTPVCFMIQTDLLSIAFVFLLRFRVTLIQLLVPVIVTMLWKEQMVETSILNEDSLVPRLGSSRPSSACRPWAGRIALPGATRGRTNIIF